MGFQVSIKHVFQLLTCCILVSCASVNSIKQMPSNNSSYRVKSLVMHFTAVNYEDSIKYLVNEGGGVSSHYLIPQINDDTYPKSSIEILQLVDENERAWHAGLSYWQGRTGLNDSSIGIEIVNVPECFEHEVPEGFIKPKSLCIFPEFENEQIELLIELSQGILARNPDIEPTAVVGHSDIAPSRKNDPGPRFPWQKLYEAGIGAWYEKDTVAKYWQMFNAQKPNIGLVQKALNLYGYGIDQTGILDRQTQDVLGAFQMHFLPWQVNYQSDNSTAATIFALLEKYFPERLSTVLEQYEQNQSNELELTEKAHNQLQMIFTQDSEQPLYKQNRVKFIAVARSGSMIIQSENIESADIYINEQKLNVSEAFSAKNKTAKVYSIAKRTQDGLNSLRVDNIKGDGALNISIPYPQINQSDEQNKNYDFSALDAFIQNDVEQGFPGANLLIVHKGKIIKQSSYGYARKYADGGDVLTNPLPMTIETKFDLASNTKVFATTLAIMKLVDQGKLSLTTPLANYLAEYSGNGRDTRTVADLLSHASGYNSEVQFFKADNPLGSEAFSQDKDLTAEILLAKLPFAATRRSTQTYSDTNFLILGLLVERITHMPLDEYVEKHIYAPLGLSNTKFVPLQKGHEHNEFAATEILGNSRGGHVTFENIRTHVLQGEVHDEKAHYSMQGVAGHAGLFSNAHELAVLAQLLLNGGGYNDVVIFDQDTINRFIHPEFTKNSIGLGWRLSSPETSWHFGPYASAQAFGHTGWTGTATVIDPELDLAIIYLTNKKHSKVRKVGSNLAFDGDSYNSARYGNIMALAYEAVLQATHKNIQGTQ